MPTDISKTFRDFVILDRDGTINVEKHYLSDPDQLELLPGAVDGLRRFQDMGFAIIIVTNQSGIARGYFDVERLEQIHGRLRKMLRAEGIQINGIYFSDDHPDHPSDRRKPGPGMILEAAQDFSFDPAKAFVAGDKACDINMGIAVGATTFLVRTGYGAKSEAESTCEPDYVVDNLDAMAATIADLIQARQLDAA